MSHLMLFPALFPAAIPSLYHGTCSPLGLCCQPLDCKAVLEGVRVCRKPTFFVPKVLFQGIVPLLRNIARF